MTPPDFCFVLPWGFLGTGAQQLSEWVTEFLCAQRSVLTPCHELLPSPRAAPPGLCQARGPIVCAKSLRPTALELCQCKTCSLPWLKAEPNTAGWGTWTEQMFSHQKSTCVSGAFQNRCHAEETTSGHGDKASLTLTHLHCVSYRLVFWFYNNKRGLLSLVFPSPIAILHPKGCLWKQGYMHVWGRAAALWNKGSAHNPLEGEPSFYTWSLLTKPMSLCLVTFR